MNRRTASVVFALMIAVGLSHSAAPALRAASAGEISAQIPATDAAPASDVAGQGLFTAVVCAACVGRVCYSACCGLAPCIYSRVHFGVCYGLFRLTLYFRTLTIR